MAFLDENGLKTFWEKCKTRIDEMKLKEHASATNEYGVGSGTLYGHLKLSDSINSTLNVNGGTAATPYAVKFAMDTLLTKITDDETEWKSVVRELEAIAIEYQKNFVDLNIIMLNATGQHMTGVSAVVKTAAGTELKRLAYSGAQVSMKIGKSVSYVVSGTASSDSSVVSPANVTGEATANKTVTLKYGKTVTMKLPDMIGWTTKTFSLTIPSGATVKSARIKYKADNWWYGDYEQWVSTGDSWGYPGQGNGYWQYGGMAINTCTLKANSSNNFLANQDVMSASYGDRYVNQNANKNENRDFAATIVSGKVSDGKSQNYTLQTPMPSNGGKWTDGSGHGAPEAGTITEMYLTYTYYWAG